MSGGRKEGGRKKGVRDNKRKILEGLSNFFRETFPIFFCSLLESCLCNIYKYSQSLQVKKDPVIQVHSLNCKCNLTEGKEQFERLTHSYFSQELS